MVAISPNCTTLNYNLIDQNERFSTVEKDDGKLKVIAKKLLWIVATLRNAFVLFVTSAILLLSGKNCPFPVSQSL